MDDTPVTVAELRDWLLQIPFDKEDLLVAVPHVGYVTHMDVRHDRIRLFAGEQPPSHNTVIVPEPGSLLAEGT